MEGSIDSERKNCYNYGKGTRKKGTEVMDMWMELIAIVVTLVLTAFFVEELFIAETTVKKHVTHVYEKCGVSGRKELKEHWRNFT